MQAARDSFAAAFPGAAAIAEMLGYWAAHTYLGSDSSDKTAHANKIAGGAKRIYERREISKQM